MYVYLKQQKDQISDLVGRIDSLENTILVQRDKFIIVSNSLDSLKNISIEQNSADKNDTQVDVISTMIRLKNKVKILEDRAFYTDSLYFEIINDLVIG